MLNHRGRSGPSAYLLHDGGAKTFEFGSVGNDRWQKESLGPRCQMDAELAAGDIVAIDVDGQSDFSVAKPNEPAPVFLFSLNSLISPGDNYGQQTVPNDITAPAAVVDVDAGI